jgi:hypothetical protein
MLSNDDREWLETKFNRIHERIDEVEGQVKRKGSDIHRIDKELLELRVAGCPSVLSHEDKYHNPVKTWGILSAMVGVMVGLVELGKTFFKRG